MVLKDFKGGLVFSSMFLLKKFWWCVVSTIFPINIDPPNYKSGRWGVYAKIMVFYGVLNNLYVPGIASMKMCT